ncbi:MAG: hypothetical protein ACI9RG_000995 [Sulfurimonas sp.]
MIKVVSLLLLTCSLFAIEYNSDISMKYLTYDKFNDEMTVEGSLGVKFDNDMFKTNIEVEYLYSEGYAQRRYVLLNELYMTKEYKDYKFTIGKTVKFWGELEGFNIADVYNQKNYLHDPFNKSNKLGSIGFSLWKYFDENSFEFGAKIYEEEVDYPSGNSPYNPLTLTYDKELKLSNQRYTPTLYMGYSFVTDDSVDSENKIIIIHGYDNKRYFIPSPENTLSQYAYKVNKLLFFSNLIYNDTIFKCELSYTDVTNKKNISDYSQLTFGLEKSFYDIADTDLGTYLEYYKYIYMQDGKIENVDISEIYDNDVFLALKINLNDVRGSEVKAGILYDMINKEKVFKVNAKSRIMDGLTLNVEYLQILSSKTETTLLSNIDDSTRVVVGLSYSY